VPDWVTAGAALLALAGAAFAYTYQSEQVRLHREQLADQIKATGLQSEAIAEQNRLREREQANQVEGSCRGAGVVTGPEGNALGSLSAPVYDRSS
jgi:hypothetical protein